ncbi:MAG: mechanosensitive ion channel [Candidatus Gracilibacteria bacterium]
MLQFLNHMIGIPTAFAQGAAAEKTAGTTFDILGYVLSSLPLWITAIVVFIISMILGSMLKGVVENRMAAKITEEHQELLIISGRLTFVGIVVIGGTISLAIAGINVTNLIAAIGFGISFGLQDTIANFVAGIALLASRPFTIGDWIKVDGMMGKVAEIRVRATYLNTFDGLRLIVPNSQLYKSQVLSYTSNPMRRLKVPAYIRYYADMKKVYAICLNVVKSHKDILLQPKPNVVVTEMGDYYIALEIRFWVDSKSLWRRIQSKVAVQIQKRFEESGIDAPYPTTALAFDTDDTQTFVRTKALTPEEVNNIMKMREEDEEKLEKRREELAASRAMMDEENQKNLDQSGATFLKVTTMPLPAVSQQASPVFPPNSPAAMSADQSAQQAVQQVGTPTAFGQNQMEKAAEPQGAGTPIPVEPVTPPNSQNQ